MAKYENKVIKIDVQDKKQLETIAEREGMSANQLIRTIIKEWLKNNK